MTEYDATYPFPVLFPPQVPEQVLAEIISDVGLRQLHCAETEKYAHVTFFFNGGIELPFEGEERILVPSPKVATYDLQPEMSADELTEKLVEAIGSGKYDTVICNYANPDMVGHTGNFDAAVQAIEALDGCLGQVITALQEVGGELLRAAVARSRQRVHAPTFVDGHLGDDVGQDLARREATTGPQPERDRGVQVASGNVADGVGHGQDRQAEGQRHAQEADADGGERGGRVLLVSVVGIILVIALLTLPAAMATGLPDSVPAWYTGPAGATSSMYSRLPPKAPTGMPPPITLPSVDKSGVTPKSSCAPPRATRKPVITSSKISKTPY